MYCFCKVCDVNVELNISFKLDKVEIIPSICALPINIPGIGEEKNRLSVKAEEITPLTGCSNNYCRVTQRHALNPERHDLVATSCTRYLMSF